MTAPNDLREAYTGQERGPTMRLPRASRPASFAFCFESGLVWKFAARDHHSQRLDLGLRRTTSSSASGFRSKERTIWVSPSVFRASV